MQIEKIVVGFLKENCYVLTFNNKSIIIDPGAEADKIIKFCNDKNIVGVLVTHHHFDHVGALKDIESYFQIKEDAVIPDFNYEIVYTPGHARDLKCFYFPQEEVMFTGDFILKGDIGILGLPGSNKEEMMNSLRKIKKYPGTTRLYPGHGEETLLNKEMVNIDNYIAQR